MPVFGQGKYKFDYKFTLSPLPSSYTEQVSDSNLNEKCRIEFRISDAKQEALSFSHVGIKSQQLDTLLYADLNGKTTVVIPAACIDISAFAFNYTILDLKTYCLKPNTTTIFYIELGKSFDLQIGHIRSKRKLTEAEIHQITDDLRYEKTDNELLKSKTCYITWEI